MSITLLYRKYQQTPERSIPTLASISKALRFSLLYNLETSRTSKAVTHELLGVNPELPRHYLQQAQLAVRWVYHLHPH